MCLKFCETIWNGLMKCMLVSKMKKLHLLFIKLLFRYKTSSGDGQIRQKQAILGGRRGFR